MAITNILCLSCLTIFAKVLCSRAVIRKFVRTDLLLPWYLVSSLSNLDETYTSQHLMQCMRCGLKTAAEAVINWWKIKGKGFPYSLPSVGPGADPGAQAVSPQVTISHPPNNRLPLPSARPAVTFPAARHHHPLAGTKLYCLVTEAQLAQGCYAAFAPRRIWTHDLLIASPQRSTGRATAPPGRREDTKWLVSYHEKY